MKGIEQLFEKFLRTRGLRLTKQREAILKAIYATHDHISADGLYDELMDDEGWSALKISRATVYRTLSLLTEGGFIQSLDIGGGQGQLYEHVMGHEHHDHMVCLACRKIFEFHDEKLEELQEQVVKQHGFQASSHRLNVFGTCAKCLAKGERSVGMHA